LTRFVLFVAIVVVTWLLVTSSWVPLEVAGAIDIPRSCPVADVKGTDGYDLAYQDGAVCVIGIEVTNQWPVPVTVTAVVLPTTDRHALLEPIDVSVGDRSDFLFGGQLITGTPFEPFSLSGGASRVIVIRARMTDCEFPDSSPTLDSLRLRYRFLARDRDVEFPLTAPLVVLPVAPDACVTR